MEHSAKVFVSFSSRDGEFAGKLMAGLRLQNVDVWDYSNPAQDIPLGEPVKAHLRQRIDNSTVFVAIVTAASVHPVSGRFATFEMQYAAASKRRILPVTLGPSMPANLSPELAFLEHVKYIPFHEESQQAYDDAFARLCEQMGIQYVPPFLGDPRIIFGPRFESEIRGLRMPNEHRVLLRVTMDEFTRAYAAEQWSTAKEAIEFFISGCKRFLPGVELYYPNLLLALCHMHEGRNTDALKIFEKCSQHQAADENVWGGIGQVHFIRRNYSEALKAFETAKLKCPPGKDWEARFNILATSMELGRFEEASAAFEGFDLSSRPMDDELKVLNLQGIAYSRIGEWTDAIRVLNSLCQRGLANATTAIYLARAYEGSGDARQAASVLYTEGLRLHDLNVLHHLAHLYAQWGFPEKAVEIYQKHLLCDPKRQAQMMTDYALLLRSLGRKRESNSVCRDVINLPRPKDDDAEFYFRGLAHYLLGDSAEARTLYRLSNSPQPYYDSLAGWAEGYPVRAPGAFRVPEILDESAGERFTALPGEAREPTLPLQ